MDILASEMPGLFPELLLQLNQLHRLNLQDRLLNANSCAGLQASFPKEQGAKGYLLFHFALRNKSLLESKWIVSQPSFAS